MADSPRVDMSPMWKPVSIATVLLVAVAAGDSAAESEPVAGVRLQVERSARAQICSTESELGARLAARAMRDGQAGKDAFVVIHVQFDRDATQYVARLRVSGRKAGVRAFRTNGQDCRWLEEALLLSLELLLDDDPTSPTLDHWELAFEPTGIADPGPEPLAVPTPRRPSSTGWIGAGAAAAQGLLYGTAGVPLVRGTLRVGRWSTALSGFWAPEHRIEVALGELGLTALGAQLAGCLAVARWESLQFDGCLGGAALALHGQAYDFSVNRSKTRLWWLAGGGPELHWFPHADLDIGMSLRVLASLHRESFSISPLGPGYVTPLLVGWLGADAQLRIW